MPTTEWLNKYESIKDKLACKTDLDAHFTEKVIGNMGVDVLDILNVMPLTEPTDSLTSFTDREPNKIYTRIARLW